MLLGVIRKLYYRIKFNQKNIYTTILHSNGQLELQGTTIAEHPEAKALYCFTPPVVAAAVQRESLLPTTAPPCLVLV